MPRVTQHVSGKSPSLAPAQQCDGSRERGLLPQATSSESLLWSLWLVRQRRLCGCCPARTTSHRVCRCSWSGQCCLGSALAPVELDWDLLLGALPSFSALSEALPHSLLPCLSYRRRDQGVDLPCPTGLTVPEQSHSETLLGGWPWPCVVGVGDCGCPLRGWMPGLSV